ncbi:MAG: SRPBCC family protein [Actinomycetes bacterium]
MPQIEASVVIARKPEEVFEYLADVQNLPVWDVSVVKAEQVGSGLTGLGTRFRGVNKVMGKTFDWTTEVTEFESPRRITFTAVEGRMKFTVTDVLEPVEGGTKFTYRIDAESGLGGVFGRLADPLIVKSQTRTVRANLDTLADLLAEESNH